jgi:hypothetical protein
VLGEMGWSAEEFDTIRREEVRSPLTLLFSHLILL